MKKMSAYLVFALIVLLIPNNIVEANTEECMGMMSEFGQCLYESSSSEELCTVSNMIIPKHKYICLEGDYEEEQIGEVVEEEGETKIKLPLMFSDNESVGLLGEFSEDVNDILKEEEEVIVPLTVVKTSSSSIYDVFTTAELELIFRVVEAETYGNHYEEHLHVANVIFNRLRGVGNSYWGKNITEVLTSPRQFMVVTNGFYKTVKVSEETVRAVEDAWKCDYTNGSLFFDSTNGKSWAAKNRTFVFRDGAGHDFYK